MWNEWFLLQKRFYSIYLLQFTYFLSVMFFKSSMIILILLVRIALCCSLPRILYTQRKRGICAKKEKKLGGGIWMHVYLNSINFWCLLCISILYGKRWKTAVSTIFNIFNPPPPLLTFHHLPPPRLSLSYTPLNLNLCSKTWTLHSSYSIIPPPSAL